jgi:hypothetical protein
MCRGSITSGVEEGGMHSDGETAAVLGDGGGGGDGKIRLRVVLVECLLEEAAMAA